MNDTPMIVTGPTVEISIIAERFPRIARGIVEDARVVIVNVVCTDGKTFKGIRVDRSTLYVRWKGKAFSTLDSFWINPGNGSPVFFWPSADNFNGSATISSQQRRTIKSLHVPVDLL